MPRPSEPVLTWLRTMITKRGLNTASLASATKLDRNELRKALAGSEPMTLDMLMLLSNALNLSPADMGLAPELAAEDKPAGEATGDGAAAAAAPVPNADLVPNPWGNHPEQLFRIGFALGCDFFFIADTGALADSGVPAATIKSSGKNLSIGLDARFHADNAPRYDENGVTLTLSFDRLYDCHFPWASIRQVIFFPAPPEAHRPAERGADAGEPSQSGSSPPGATRERGHLRLVTDE
jgi:transcriptional regulator with XRE-family HTH domain